MFLERLMMYVIFWKSPSFFWVLHTQLLSIQQSPTKNSYYQWNGKEGPIRTSLRSISLHYTENDESYT